MSTAAKVVLFVVLPLLVLVLIAVTTVVAASVLRGNPVNERFDLEAGSRVEVTVPNASMEFGPSEDDLVHVIVTGSYFGPEPTIDALTSGDVTTVRGSCREEWFNRCSLRITVALPESLPLSADGRNGRISAVGLTGALELETTNGGIDARTVRGDLDLRTTNGGIRVEDSRSADVTASTTNGNVDLYFTQAPQTVDAESTNGPVTVRVPDDGEEYFVAADTTNGTVDTDTVPSDRRAEREITAETTNGNVTVERANE
ncbi:MAG TPA: DUF4097 family beta strand repeat-containing protein [Glaciibacter sp.]|nr:DUF4097 family beta strand repeat-containing protein [Glaciibacter sp.]